MFLQRDYSHCFFVLCSFCFHMALAFCYAVSGEVSAFESLFLLEILVSGAETSAWAGIVKMMKLAHQQNIDHVNI